MPIGTLVLPDPADVALGVQYGADGTEFTGTLTVGSLGAAPALSSVQADNVWRSVRHRLDEQLPDNWKVYARRDFTVLPADDFPACYVVMLPERLLEEESDNQTLVGYAAGVCLMVKEAGVKRTDPALEAMRRRAQRAVYTTAYVGLEVEQILVEEALPAPLPGEEEMITATGFTVIVGLLEQRET